MRRAPARGFSCLLTVLCATTAASAQPEQPGLQHAPLPAPAPHAARKLPDEGHGPPCDPAFIEHVYRATKPSVVRITRPDGSLGTGFVFFDSSHVVTALHVVDLGRDVRVEFPSGKSMEAEVVAIDDAHDLALLELSEPTDVAPLEPRFNVSVGSPILAIGNPYGDLARFSGELEGLLNFSVSQGIVSAKSESFIQTDTVLSPGNSGGPMLTCDGKVVGVADRLLESRIGFGVPVQHLEKLAGSIGRSKYRGRWVLRDGALGFAWQADTSAHVGFYLGGSLVGYDRVAMTLRLGMTWSGKGDSTAPIVDRSMRRIFGEFVLGYRILLFPYAFPTYFTVGGGMLATFDRGEETRLAITNATPPALVAQNKDIRGGGVAPLAQAALHLGSLEASYGFALDVIHPKLSTHRLLIGLSF